MKHQRTINLICILAIVLSGVFSLNAVAAPGDFDPTFSQDGVASEALGNGGDDIGYATAIQPDGKIIVAGSAKYGYGDACSITRYNPDGSFDASFNGNGKAFAPGDYPTYCSAVAIQPDGRIVAAGYTELSSSVRFGFIARFNSNGVLDNGFDGDGKLKIDTVRHLKGVAVQMNGKIVAAGYSGASGAEDFALVSRNADGSPDTAFDGDGLVTTSFSSGTDIANAVAIQADGKIVAAGSNNVDFALARYNPNGSLDTTFDGDGLVTTNIVSIDFANAVAIQPDGKILAAGYSDIYFSIARYNIDGSLDTSFDLDGKTVTNILNRSDIAYGIALQTDGKIVLAGRSANGSGTNISLVRYNPNGSLDTSFDGDGKLTTPVLEDSDYAYAVAIQADGKILAAGNVRSGKSFVDLNDDTVLVRYHTDGSLDASFDGDGKLIVNIGVKSSAVYAIAVQTDGKIVAAGYSNETRQNIMTLARYNPDGSYDPTFDGDGKLTTSIGLGDSFANAVAIQTDGKIVVAGFCYTGNGRDVALVRYNTDGSLDSTFDGDGRVTTPFLNADNSDEAEAIAIQPDGRILIAGSSVYSTAGEVAIFARYNPDGSLDTSFDGDGKLTISEPVIYRASALAIQTDGKIVAAGRGINGFNTDFALARLNPNGSFDTSFDGDGKVLTPVLNSQDYADCVIIQPDGKIIAGGSARTSNSSIDTGALVRYNPNGSLDASFDGDGKLTAGSGANFYALALQADGKILAAGGGLTRYNPDGSLDTLYGLNGVAGNGNFGGISLVLDSSGRAVLGGVAEGPFFAVARIINSASSVSSPYDFDGDGKTDIAIFRPSTGEWWINGSATSATSAAQFGNSSDKIVPGDYTGDGKTDIAVFRGSTGEWFILRSEDGSYYSIPFGTSGDVAVPSDYDGDDKTDIAVFRPSTGTWYISNSSGGTQIVGFGIAGDIPTIGDYDRDGKTDISIWRPSTGIWWILNSATATITLYAFGNSTDIPVAGDYTGDGRTDSAIFRPSTGEWFIRRSENRTLYAVPFGTSGDIPAPGDYDGDGKFDTAVFRPSNSTWYINRSTAGILFATFGLSSDRPVPAAFVR